MLVSSLQCVWVAQRAPIVVRGANLADTHMLVTPCVQRAKTEAPNIPTSTQQEFCGSVLSACANRLSDSRYQTTLNYGQTLSITDSQTGRAPSTALTTAVRPWECCCTLLVVILQ